jgi:hypothetical protein
MSSRLAFVGDELNLAKIQTNLLGPATAKVTIVKIIIVLTSDMFRVYVFLVQSM